MDVFDVSVKDILMENAPENAPENDRDANDEAKQFLKSLRKKQKPRHKLDTVRLISDNGLMNLDKELSSFVFKGKGHEAHDLNRLMEKYKLWTQQLIGEISFTDCIDKIQDLGHKKEVRSIMKQYRNQGFFPSEFVTDKIETVASDVPIDNFNYADFNFEEEFAEEWNGGVNVVEPRENEVLTSAVVEETQSELTEEQLERIERNKLKAIELKKAANRSAL